MCIRDRLRLCHIYRICHTRTGALTRTSRFVANVKKIVITPLKLSANFLIKVLVRLNRPHCGHYSFSYECRKKFAKFNSETGNRRVVIGDGSIHHIAWARFPPPEKSNLVSFIRSLLSRGLANQRVVSLPIITLYTAVRSGDILSYACKRICKHTHTHQGYKMCIRDRYSFMTICSRATQ